MQRDPLVWRCLDLNLYEHNFPQKRQIGIFTAICPLLHLTWEQRYRFSIQTWYTLMVGTSGGFLLDGWSWIGCACVHPTLIQSS